MKKTVTTRALSSDTSRAFNPSCRLTPDRHWIIETVDGEERRFRISQVIYQGRTAYQSVAVVESDEFGTLLVIDGETQSAEDDEYVYHEALVQPAMIAHALARRVLVIGGGEGATLREVLRHHTVERAVMVDIDGELIALARTHLGTWHQGAFDDPRTDLRVGDGMAFLQTTAERFDVIVVDVCDYVEDTAAANLYSDAFIDALKRALAPAGLLVLQAGELGCWANASHIALAGMLRRAFGSSVSYSTFVESFWSEWSFLLAGEAAQRIGQLRAAEVDEAIARAGMSDKLRVYDGITHQRMFNLAKHVRDALAGRGPA